MVTVNRYPKRDHRFFVDSIPSQKTLLLPIGGRQLLENAPDDSIFKTELSMRNAPDVVQKDKKGGDSISTVEIQQI